MSAKPPAKTPMDEAADAFLGTLQKGAAAAGAVLLRRVKDRIGGAGGWLEKQASCSCSPVQNHVTGPDGAEETVVVHARDCPAR